VQVSDLRITEGWVSYAFCLPRRLVHVTLFYSHDQPGRIDENELLRYVRI
jgi:hypothetical protein